MSCVFCVFVIIIIVLCGLNSANIIQLYALNNRWYIKTIWLLYVVLFLFLNHFIFFAIAQRFYLVSRIMIHCGIQVNDVLWRITVYANLVQSHCKTSIPDYVYFIGSPTSNFCGIIHTYNILCKISINYAFNLNKKLKKRFKS